LARLAESAKFDSLFLADGPVLQGTGEFRTPGQLEPLTLLTALAAATERIGLIATDRHRLDDVQQPLQPGAPAGVGRPRQRGTRRVEHRHLGDLGGGGQLRARRTSAARGPVRAGG
jgi:hypothetical protein